MHLVNPIILSTCTSFDALVGIELMGRRRTITVIFGETDDATVLGVTAL
jgi:hypothetical protein